MGGRVDGRVLLLDIEEASDAGRQPSATSRRPSVSTRSRGHLDDLAEDLSGRGLGPRTRPWPSRAMVQLAQRRKRYVSTVVITPTMIATASARSTLGLDLNSPSPMAL
jgi:hypothetical protein